MKNPYTIIAGGGDSSGPTQDQMQQQIQISPPEPPNNDMTLLWASGVIVPLVVAFLGYLAVKHRRS